MLKFGAAVLYVDDVPAVLRFYEEALGLVPSYYDEAAGFAQLGEAGHLTLASHAAGELMMPGAYRRAGNQPSGVEVAFLTDDVASAYERAVAAGAGAMTPPREMPWGQRVAYVRSIEGSIIGFLTPPPASSSAA